MIIIGRLINRLLAELYITLGLNGGLQVLVSRIAGIFDVEAD